jgi:hypothetical protein
MLCKSVCEIGLRGSDPANGFADETVALEGPVPAPPVTLAACAEPKIADTMFPRTLIVLSDLLLVADAARDFNQVMNLGAL